jgi:hypothetical protein
LIFANCFNSFCISPRVNPRLLFCFSSPLSLLLPSLCLLLLDRFEPFFRPRSLLRLRLAERLRERLLSRDDNDDDGDDDRVSVRERLRLRERSLLLPARPLDTRRRRGDESDEGGCCLGELFGLALSHFLHLKRFA